MTIIGIDLGTTNSGVAIVEDRIPQMLAHGEERIIPSVVGYNADGKWLVGTPARNQYVLDPDNTVVSVKRHMGSDEIYELSGKTFTPTAVSAVILRTLKKIAEKSIGEPVTEAVITVPAYFSDAQRQATRDAGRIAGLNVRRIINEPTAAALAYGLNQAEDQLVLVYDLGGGTFDVSLVELMGGIVEVRATHGNTKLGGDDFDEALATMLAAEFALEHEIDLRDDRRAWARLLRAAEQAKIELSDHPFVSVKEAYIIEKDGVPLHLEQEISRVTFEEMIEEFLKETAVSIQRVLDDASVKPDEIDEILLVGGSSRIPAVWELLTDMIGIEPMMGINPDEAVALGAGVQAAIIEGQPIDAILVDVTPYSLGIEVAEHRGDEVIDDRYSILIHRNTTIPTTKEERFFTFSPEQDIVHIKAYQGERKVASQNILLGDFNIEGLTSKTDRPTEILVRFDFDVDGIVHVTAENRQTGESTDISVEASLTRMDEDEMMAAQKLLTATPLSDTDYALIKQIEVLLARDDVPKKEKGELKQLAHDIAEAQTNNDDEQLDELLEILADRLFDLE